MKVAFLYGGQGSQEVGMGYDFYENEKIAKDFYDNIKIDKDIKKLSFNSDKETLKNTENTQVVLVAFDILVTKILNGNKIYPDAVAGLSIGEFGALYASEVLKEEDVLKISEFRGEKMKNASKNIDTAMFAVMGVSEEELEKICKKNSDDINFVSISNLNTKNQIVISGERKSVLKAVEDIKTLGKRAIELNVSGPFHTKYMEDVSSSLKKYFKEIEFSKEKIDVYYNLLGNKNKDSLDTKEIMVRQVSECVRFEDILRNMIKDGIDTFIEIGYFGVLKGFIKKIDRGVKVYSISDYDSYKELLREIKDE